jgi:hypothetical protein
LADNGRVRIEVGFDGGQIMGAFVDLASADQLEQALQDGPPTLSLETDDGRYTVVLSRVLYVKRFSRESRVGFGAG